ncbi:MAG: asparagine synthase (glutamine-hydrolyzing) [Acidobacteria bacterium]|nr:asparagine synthase (glutamine-hydrolyzing) [Acidobacteriota bacterium]
MCGIAGIIGSESQDAGREKVSRMLEILKHRGPNDAGIEIWDSAVLGHRRLSIFDLSAAGHQPMLSPERDIGIVFNGAIYNFRALRAELEEKGCRFRSQTDTEILIYGYREWGFDRLVAKMQGMFAIGLWDERRKTLFLVRDRLGVKPLAFAAADDGEIAFASTVRALKAAGCGGDLDADGVAEYLEFGFLTDDRAIYKNIEKVAAGEIVEWRDGKIEKRNYWNLPPVAPENKISFDEAIEETERLFLLAVEKRLQADVPIGALLSGGIDSSLVCWAIGKLGGDVTAFTVGTPNDAFDETNVAAQTAKLLDIKHKVLELSSEKQPNIGELVKAYAEPFACASALGMLEISGEVKKSATVLLTGDGGDDVFLGYPEHRHFFLSGKIACRAPDFAAGLWLKTRGNIPRIGTLKRAVSFFDYSMGGLGAVGSARDGLPVYRHNNLLGERLRNVSLPHREMKWTIESGRNLLSEFLAYDRRTRFVGEYLPKVDGGTMFHALEARSPFLDAELWEFAAKLPFALRLHKGKSKAVLREIVRRRIGERLASGKKQGFIIPVQKWLTAEWRKPFTELLRDSLAEKEGWIDARAALKLLEKSVEKNWAPRQLWFIFVLESWLRFEKNLSTR